MLEEVLDLFDRVLGDVADVLNVRPARVLRGNGDDLRIRPCIVGHIEYGDGAHGDADTREQRVIEQDQHIDRVAVEAERVLEVPIVGGVDERREQHAVEKYAPGDVVDLVLVATALGDLDDCGIRGHGVVSKEVSRCGRPGGTKLQ